MWDELQGLISGELHLDLPTRLIFARDGSAVRMVPEAVLRPQNEDDLRGALAFAHSQGLAVGLRGGGTGRAGGSLTAGLLLDLGAHFKDILVEPAQGLVEAGAAASIGAIENKLAPHGLTLGFPPEWRERSVGGLFSSVSPDFQGNGPNLLTSIKAARFLLPEGQLLTLEKEEGGTPSIPMDSLDLWSQRLPLLAEASAEADRHRRGQLLPGPRMVQGMVDPFRQAMHLLSGSMGRSGVLLKAQLKAFPVKAKTTSLLISFSDLGQAVTFFQGRSFPGPWFCDLFDRRLVRTARVFFQDEWLRWADNAGEWVALITLEGEAISALQNSGGVFATTFKSSFGEVDGERVRFVIRGGVAKGEGDLLRSAITDLYLNLESLEGGIRKIGLIMGDHRLVPAFLVHPDRGQVEVLPVTTHGDLSGPNQLEGLLKAAGEAIVRQVLVMGGSYGLENGFGSGNYQWTKHLPGWWNRYQTDIAAILDPGGILKKNLEEPYGANVTVVPEGQPGEKVPAKLPPLKGCFGCGGCRGTKPESRLCPGFSSTGLEEGAPRARALLAEAFQLGELGEADLLNGKVQEIAGWCLQCRMCETSCPSGLDIPEWSLELAKAKYLAEGSNWTHWFLAHADRLAPWLNLAAPLVNPLLRFKPVRWLVEKLSGISRERELPRFFGRPFLQTAQKSGWTQFKNNGGNKAAYFVDYYANYHKSGIAEALVKVLQHNKVDVVVPKGQGSCGMAALVQGNQEAATEYARKNVRVLAELAREDCPILFTEPTAALFFKKDLPRLLPGEESTMIAERVVDASRYLLELHKNGGMRSDFRRLDVRLDHHIPCHVRALDGNPASPDLMRLIPGADVRVLDLSCSGMAGLWGMDRQNLVESRRIAQPMLEKWAEKTAAMGTSECSACRIQMAHKDNRPVLHPVEVLAWGYGFTGFEKLDKRI